MLRRFAPLVLVSMISLVAGGLIGSSAVAQYSTPEVKWRYYVVALGVPGGLCDDVRDGTYQQVEACILEEADRIAWTGGKSLGGYRWVLAFSRISIADVQNAFGSRGGELVSYAPATDVDGFTGIGQAIFRLSYS